MNATKFSIMRPLALLMAVLALFIFGVKSYKELKTSLMPETNIPFVLVQTVYPGASAEVVESQVSIPLEKELYSLPGIKDLRSYSYANASMLMMEFNMETNPDQAVTDVTKRLNEIVPSLPKDIVDPKVQKVDQNAAPVLEYALYGNDKDKLATYVKETLKPRLEQVDGVGKVDIYGLDERQVKVVLKDNAASKGVTVSLISDALANKVYGAKIPGRIPLGNIKEGGRETSVEIDSEFTTLDEIKELYVNPSSSGLSGATPGLKPVKIGEVADVTLVDKTRESYYRANGKNAVGISITKQSDASDVQVAENIKKLMGGEKPIPTTKMIAGVFGFHFDKEKYDPEIDFKAEGLEAKVTSDQSIWIKESVDGVMESLIEGILLTGLFLLLFLRSARSTLIVLLAIPTSIVVTFIGMRTLGFTLNIVSLLGVAMSVGILVDDSIVVIENIFAKLRKISDPKEAALTGRMEIGAAAVAITLVDVVVYLPLAMLSGMVGQFFRQFAAVVVVATLSSLVIAFTLTPMLTSRLVRQKDEEGYRWLRWSEKIIDLLKELYGRFLSVITKTGWRVAAAIILVFAVLGGSVAIAAPHLKQEFMVQGDDGTGSLAIEFPTGTSVEKVNTEVTKIENILKNKEEVNDFYAVVGQGGSNSASIRFYFGPKEERDKSSKQLVSGLQKEIDGILPNEVVVSASQASMGWGNKEVQYILTGSDFNELVRISEEFEKKIKDKNILKDISFSLGSKSQDIVVDIGQKASQNGVNAAQIMGLTAGKIKPSESGVLRQGNDEIDIVVEDAEQIQSEQALRDLALAPGATLSSVADIKEISSYKSIERINKRRSITFGANLKSGVDSGKASREIDTIVKDMNFKGGYDIKADSGTRLMQEGFAELGSALALSIGLVFMIMVALYESLLIPFVIMFTLPTAVAGSFLLLYLLDAPMDITAMVGFIALMGLVAKNGILLVDFMEKERETGADLRTVIVNAGRRRLRPILMTTLSIIVASIPLVLGNVPGSEFRRGIAIVFIGGLLSSLLLTLVLIPCIYMAVVSIRERIFKKGKTKDDEKTERAVNIDGVATP